MTGYEYTAPVAEAPEGWPIVTVPAAAGLPARTFAVVPELARPLERFMREGKLETARTLLEWFSGQDGAGA